MALRASGWVTLAVVAVASTAVFVSFSQGASPYVTVAQARSMSGDRLHLACDLIPGTVKTDFSNHSISFDAKDEKGTKVTIVHTGDPVNLKDATRVVAVGSFKGDVFQSSQLLVKCPSKYEGESGKPGNKEGDYGTKPAEATVKG